MKFNISFKPFNFKLLIIYQRYKIILIPVYKFWVLSHTLKVFFFLKESRTLKVDAAKREKSVHRLEISTAPSQVLNPKPYDLTLVGINVHPYDHV